jgi:hypothetical protein
MSIRIAPPPEDLPEVTIGVDLERMTDAAISSLATDPRVYQRAGMLVGVVSAADVPGPITRAKSAPVIRPLGQATIRERLSSTARWLKRSQKGYAPAYPPEPVVSAVVGRGEWKGVRPLTSVSTAPCLRPDGSVLQRPGYDEPTGILYSPNDAYPEVKDRPTLDDARGAVEALREVCCDFPFARPEHESAWLAGVLTMLARPAIAGPTPLFAVDATTRGTGKSRLVDAAVLLCSGQAAARMPLPEDDDEMRKRITTLLGEGDGAILLDNVTRAIALPSLDAVLTADVWADRMLGANVGVRLPARSVWWTTGNNLALAGDLSRRTLHIRLESPLENPEERTGFRHANLLEWIRVERRRLVACALTVLRAAALASPPSVSLWGSYESWSKLVPPALAWVGLPSPMLARATAGSVHDEEKQNAVCLLDGLRLLCPDDGRGAVQPLSCRRILDALYADRDERDGPRPPDKFDDLREAIESETNCPPGRKPDPKRLGKWMQRVRGRVIGGWSVCRLADSRGNATWRAEPVAAS